MVPPEKIKKLVLGTAQFGLNYGISNKRGLIPRDEAFAIFRTAHKAGVEMLDTAQAYGTSEEVIGSFLKSARQEFKVVTKLNGMAREDVIPALARSREKTGVDKFYGVMMHDFGSYEGDPAIYDALLEARARGMTVKTGFSLYHPRQAETILDSGVDFDLVQIPYNIFDRRFEGIIPALAASGVEVHVRSVFLQGLLLMAPETLPAHFGCVRGKIESLRKIASVRGVSVPALCLAYVLGNPDVQRVVIGIGSLSDLNENMRDLSEMDKKLQAFDIHASMSHLRENNEAILLPQNWGKATA